MRGSGSFLAGLQLAFVFSHQLGVAGLQRYPRAVVAGVQIDQYLGTHGRQFQPARGPQASRICTVAMSPAGPLKVSTTRTVMISSDFCRSCSTLVTSPEKRALAQSYQRSGWTFRVNRQACAQPVANWEIATTSK